MGKDLRPVYTAPTEAAARERFEEFDAKWGGQYPAITRLWRNAWTEFIPFLDWGGCRGIDRWLAGASRQPAEGEFRGVLGSAGLVEFPDVERGRGEVGFADGWLKAAS